ncbi:hypothetical protein TNCV_2006981 [Trichonephila clavipes]|nr:hypothetical protein TNCV_2006981 [Trichonephila clavipes]
MPDIKTNGYYMFGVERRLNVYLNSNKLEQLENQHSEIDKIWAFCFDASRQKPSAAWHGQEETILRHIGNMSGTSLNRSELKYLKGGHFSRKDRTYKRRTVLPKGGWLVTLQIRAE